MRSSPESPLSNTQMDFDSNGVSGHTRALAERLSGHMGLEAAIQVSTENQWHGVLAALLDMQSARASRSTLS